MVQSWNSPKKLILNVLDSNREKWWLTKDVHKTLKKENAEIPLMRYHEKIIQHA